MMKAPHPMFTSQTLFKFVYDYQEFVAEGGQVLTKTPDGHGMPLGPGEPKNFRPDEIVWARPRITSHPKHG